MFGLDIENNHESVFIHTNNNWNKVELELELELESKCLPSK